MGQYYKVLVRKDKDSKWQLFNRSVDGEYTMAKLTEHSWWYNPFVNTICHMIHFKPKQVAWVGDYADDISAKGIDTRELHEKAWGKANGRSVTEAQISLFGKYLVNHDKKEYVDCTEYYDNSVTEGDWCLHPLPILTAVGNGQGGGDYHGRSMDMVGRWTCDRISVENAAPKEGYRSILPVFVQHGDKRMKDTKVS